MFALLLLVLTAGIAWVLVAPGQRFVAGFARLLTQPEVHRGPFSVLSGRSSVTGAFRGRDVTVEVQLKRSRYGQGYLVVSVRMPGAESLDRADIDARAPDEAGRQALAAVAAHGLTIVGVEGGWLRARWQPQGFVIFPGRFVEEDWRGVLNAMDALAASLEATP